MIIGIGIDSVEIERFSHWHLLPPLSLRRILSEAEITYCLSNPIKSAERFAARFAAREALFKAYSLYTLTPTSFLAFCKQITIEKQSDGTPVVIPNKTLIDAHHHFLLSWTHTSTTATAIALLQTHH